ncbi:ABC transporter transmembrane domain-containing protein, partial [Staphylococcus aureus]|nr:ABC transporter transmembrane domain-containing protein [Staphylococcus aureus]
LGIFAIESVLKFVVTYWGHKLGTNIERDMRNDLYSHIQKLNFKYFDNQKSGKLIGRLTNDLMDIGEAAHHGPEDIFLSI